MKTGGLGNIRLVGELVGLLVGVLVIKCILCVFGVGIGNYG